mgnify:CR=1 FL=1
MSKIVDPEYTGIEPKVKQKGENNTPQFPTEIVDLPSKGILYDEGNPLRSGKVELKYMTAREEDILTSQNLIKQGVVIDKLLKALIVSNGEGEEVPYHKLLIGDKNAIMVSARILAYGAEYEAECIDPFTNDKQKVKINLLNLKDKELNADEYKTGNRFTFTLPASKKDIEFKLLQHGDEVKIDLEIKSLKKLRKEVSSELTTRLKHMILSVDGETDKSKISGFVDNMLSRDSLALRKRIQEITPDLDMTFDFISEATGESQTIPIPLGVSFFWPGV